MPKFTFTALGKTFEIDAPAGTTQAKAQEVFNKQLNTGSLVGLAKGDVLNAATQAKDGLATAVSQLGPNAGAAIASLSTQLPNLGSIPMPTTANISSFVTQNIAQVKIGSLDPAQIQGLVSQAATQVGQAATALTNDKGLGKFGLNPTQLEQQGLLKPGTAKFIQTSGANITSVLSSPTSWTGKDGATNLASVLSNEKLQNKVQQSLMAVSFDKLGQLGSITKGLSADKLGPIVQNATKFGVDAAQKWLNGSAPAGLVNQLNSFAKGAQFGTAFGALNQGIASGGSPLVTSVKEVKGFSNTVDRATVNQGSTAVIGNPKVPSPNYGPPPKPAPASKEDLKQQLKTLQDQKADVDTEYSELYNESVQVIRSRTGTKDYVSQLITKLETLKAKITPLQAKFSALEKAAFNANVFDVYELAAKGAGGFDKYLIILPDLIARLKSVLATLDT